MTLHTFNKSPAQGAAMLAQCLLALAPGDSLLFIEDAVYAALAGGLPDTLPQDVRLYVLSEDLAARGISARIRPEFSRVDYQGFVALCLQHARVVNWN
jgi:tRNA 2-thiouridine synthesizing protein B